ncbi:MAG: superoxide dismutase family protein [Terricaulis sp.]
MRYAPALVSIAVLSGCAWLGLDERAAPAPPALAPQTAWIVGLDGRAIGQATFVEGNGGVLIRLEISQGALTPGWHGLHLHQSSDCTDAAQNFRAAGAHVSHPQAPPQHGLLNPAPPEAGDLPNLFASPTGPIGVEVFSQRVTLHNPAFGDREPLLDQDGSALIIHASPDDHVTQPAGGAGARVACAALPTRP